jgi:hypothetical protein
MTLETAKAGKLRRETIRCPIREGRVTNSNIVAAPSPRSRLGVSYLAQTRESAPVILSSPKGTCGGIPMTEQTSTTLHGTVEKIITSSDPSEPEKAQIAIENADKLYREIRIENTLTNGNGEEVNLKKGAAVEVTIEA